MFTTLLNSVKNKFFQIQFKALLVLVVDLLILPFAVSGQDLQTLLPTETVVCAGTSGVVLQAAADHPNKRLDVQWQIFQNGTWTNISGSGVTSTFAKVGNREVTTTQLSLSTYTHNQVYRVAFGVNGVNPTTASAVTATTIIIPNAAFTFPATDIYTNTTADLLFSGAASAKAIYKWSFSPAANFTAGTTSESKNPAVTWSTPGAKTITLTVADGNCSVTTTQIVNVNGTYTWTGTANADWFNAANWLANAVPGPKDDVTIAQAPFNPELATSTSIRNLTIQSGKLELGTAVLTLNGNATLTGGNLNGGTVIFNGNLAVSQANVITVPNAIFAGSANQTINNQGPETLTFTNLTIDKQNNNVALVAALAVTGTLDLKNANKLQLGNSDLRMGAAAQIIAGTMGYVVTNGTGTLQMTVANDNTQVFFPVGNHSYNPVKIKQTAAGTTDIFKVRVQGGLFDLYGTDNTGVEPPVEDGISRTWVIEETLKGGSDAQVTLQFSPNNAGNDWTPSFTLDKAVFAQYIDSWSAAKMGKPLFNSTNNMMEVSQANISSFRLFGVFNHDHQGLTTLPVDLISFKALRINGQVELQWATATEKNNDYFTLEQSTDGKIFSETAQVKGAGNSTRKLTYSYLHKNAPARLTYYRLKQTDYDGTVSYSKMVVVNALAAEMAVSAFPNPSTGQFKITGIAYGVEASIVGANGQPVKKLIALENSLTFDITNQPAGIYILHLNSGNEVKTIRLIKK